MNKNFTAIAASLLVLVVVLLVIAASVWGSRWVNAASVRTQIVTPAEGVQCVIATTTDGASIDCNWEK